MRYASAMIWGARFALLRGDTTTAYELAREGARIARPFALRAQAAALHVTLAEAALHVGDTALARREARAATRSADVAWYARDAERTRMLAARILARADALDGEPAAALAATDGDDALSLADAATFAALAGTADAVDRRERARRALTGAVAIDGADAVALLAAAEMLDYLAALAGDDGETPLATAPFDALVARRAEPLRLAHLAFALRGLPSGTQRPEAYEAGFALATQHGPRFETHVIARFAEPLLRGRPIAPKTDGLVEPLTPREHEILELLAAGLTNREIAQRLIVSARTVETHVARVTGKLGVNSRARAVARAVSLGIVAGPSYERALA